MGPQCVEPGVLSMEISFIRSSSSEIIISDIFQDRPVQHHINGKPFYASGPSYDNFLH